MLLDRAGYSQGQSLARPHPSGRLQSALHPQPRHQLYRLVPVEQHDLTGLGVAGHVEQGEALYQLSQPPVAGGLHQGFGAGLQMLSFPSDMGMLPGLVMQTPQGVQSSFILGGGTPQLQQALGGSAHRGQGEEQHPGMVSLVLGQMPLHLQMPGVHTVAALQPSSGVSQFLVQPQQQALFAPQGSALHSSILTHAQHMPGNLGSSAWRSCHVYKMRAWASLWADLLPCSPPLHARDCAGQDDASLPPGI